MGLKFEIDKKVGKSRLGRLITKHGIVHTPAFMPVSLIDIILIIMQVRTSVPHPV